MKLPIYSLMILCLATGCKKMDDKYKEFVVPGGVIYPGKADSPKFYPGFNRGKLAWLRGADPLVTKARIYWNNYTDSVDVPVPPKADTVSYLFSNLEEKDYTFNIRTFDDKGNASAPVELNGRVYGPLFASRLLNRPIVISTHEANNDLTINWGVPDTLSGAFATDVTYTTNNDQQVTRRIDVLTNETVFPDHKQGTDFSFATLFVPGAMVLDTFHSPADSFSPSVEIDRSAWTATASTFEATGQLPKGGPAEFVLDGKTDTYWHSRHTSSITGYPYWLAFDMKQRVKVTRVELNSRPDYFREDFKAFTIQISDDGVTWTSLGSYQLPDSPDPQSFVVATAPVTRYIRLYMTSGVSIHSHLAEFKVYGLPQ